MSDGRSGTFGDEPRSNDGAVDGQREHDGDLGLGRRGVLKAAGVAGVGTVLPVGAEISDALGSAAPSVEWDGPFGGDGTDFAFSLTTTSDGGYAFCGQTTSNASGYDAWLVKTDGDGAEKWSERYGGDGTDRALSVVQADDGSFVMAGRSNSGYSKRNGWMVKTDADGNEQWAEVFPQGFRGYLRSVVQTNDGGFLAAGSSDHFGGDVAWLVKVDENGQKQWERTYDDGGAAAVMLAYSVVETVDGGYGFSGKYEGDDSSMFLAKTDSAGNLQWLRTYGASDYENASEVVQTSDGGFVVVGVGNDLFDPVARIIKTDASGVEEWTTTFDDAYRRLGTVVEAADGGYVAGGTAKSSGNDDLDGFFAKVDADGRPVWSTFAGGDDYDTVGSLVHAHNGGYAFCGTTKSHGPDGFNGWLGKTVAPNEAPVAAFTYTPYPPFVGEPTTFDASASNDPDGSIAAYEWDFDGDGSADASGETVDHTFSEAGPLTVSLTVTDDDGATDTVTETLTVYVRADIDIVPGSDVNPVNPASKRSLEVAILGTEHLDPAADVDVGSLRFGHVDDVDVGEGARPTRTKVRDVDGDGREDVVVAFPVEDAGFDDAGTDYPLPGVGVTEATATVKLVGDTEAGGPLFGFGTVRVVGNGRSGPGGRP